MPQLVKGGKNVFGWSKVSNNDRIRIPHEVIEDNKIVNIKFSFYIISFICF